jgi:hypothetical protein
MTVYFAEEGDLSLLLKDTNKKPSFEWGETFCTLIGRHINIYTNDDFNIESASLIYYRQPIKIQIQGCVDPYTSLQSTQNVLCEFKDDVIEVIIDETVSILAGDMESFNQFSRGTESSERNN